MKIKKVASIAPDPASSNRNEVAIHIAEMSEYVYECDVHGFNVIEAKNEIELFLDRAFLNKIKIVKIIHGKGQGILAKEIKKFIKENNLIKYSKMSSRLDEMGAVLYAILN